MDEQIKGVGGLKMDIRLAPATLRALALITCKKIAKNHDSAEELLNAHYRDTGLTYNKKEF